MIHTTDTKGCLATTFRKRTRNKFDNVSLLQAADLAEEYNQEQRKLIAQIETTVFADIPSAQMRTELQRIIKRYKKSRNQ